MAHLDQRLDKNTFMPLWNTNYSRTSRRWKLPEVENSGTMENHGDEIGILFRFRDPNDSEA